MSLMIPVRKRETSDELEPLPFVVMKAVIALGEANPRAGRGLRQAVVSAARPWGNRFTELLAWSMARFVPTGSKYWLALRLSFVLAPVMRLRARDVTNSSLHEAYLLNRLIMLLTRFGGAFAVPYRVVGHELLDEIRTTPAVVYCSAHMPLIKLGMRAMLEHRMRLDAVLAAHPPDDGCIAVPGLSKRVPALLTDAKVLLKARSALAQNDHVFGLVDTWLGCDYSPNLMKLAGRCGARVVLLLTELLKDGTIEVRFLNPPDPWCSSDAGIYANLQLLHEEIRAVLCRADNH